MSKHKLDPTDISSFIDELDHSAFFRKPASPQVDKEINPQVRTSSSPQVDLSASPQVDKSASGQIPTSIQEKAERYTMRLQPSLIKEVKRYAFEHEMNDYDVVQTAIKDYLEKHT